MVGASVEGRAKTIDRDNRRAVERRLIRSMPVDMILDKDATRAGCIAGWVGRREPNILPAEVIIIACERDRMHRPVERFPQVSAKWFWLNWWGRAQLERFHACSA